MFNGYSALFYAAEKGNNAIIKTILSMSNKDLIIVDNRGFTALDIAII